jgi:hypothetical protein
VGTVDALGRGQPRSPSHRSPRPNSGLFNWGAVAIAAFAVIGLVVGSLSSSASSAATARQVPPLADSHSDLACAPPIIAGAKAGSQLRLTATLGQYGVTLTGDVVTDVAAYDELVLKSPTIVTTYEGRPGFSQSADLFSTEPSQIQPLRPIGGSWNYSAVNSKGAGICLAQFSDEPAVGLAILVATSPAGCNQCTTLVELYSAYVGLIQPIAVEDTGHFAAGITSTANGVEVVGDDPAFFGAFSDDAGAADPLRVYRVTKSGFVDVTRSQTELLGEDARSLWMDYQRASVAKDDLDGRGVLAAWAADECDLGHCQSALATVGKRGVAEVPEDPSRTDFLRSLKQMLVREGYASSAQVAR